MEGLASATVGGIILFKLLSVAIISILLFVRREWGEPAVTRDHEASVVVETDAPGDAAAEADAPVDVGSGASAGGGAATGALAAAAAVAAVTSAVVDAVPRGLRVRAAIPGGEKEGRG